MRLSDLDIKTSDPEVLLLQTPSTRLFLFLLDKMKNRFRTTVDTTIEINSRSDLQRVRDLIGVHPPFSIKWFITVDLGKVSGEDLVEVVKSSTTCFFFVTSANYRSYKGFKHSLEGVRGVFDYYINYLRRYDFLYLYDTFVSEDKRIKKALFDYVVQGYSGDIDAVMELFVCIASGEKVESRKDISNICGLGGNSIESYIFSMLKPLSGSEKGLKLVLKNRISAGLDLGETMGYGCFYHTMRKSLFTLIQLKQLILSGKVYKTVMGLPSAYNEKQIAKYQKYIWRLNGISLSNFLELYSCMGDIIWVSDMDLLRFIYSYYDIKGKRKAGQ